ncbi:MAG: hypothetical protein H7841_18355 [Magnetospirillum sp. WYHS-4]
MPIPDRSSAGDEGRGPGTGHNDGKLDGLRDKLEKGGYATDRIDEELDRYRNLTPARKADVDRMMELGLDPVGAIVVAGAGKEDVSAMIDMLGMSDGPSKRFFESIFVGVTAKLNSWQPDRSSAPAGGVNGPRG